MKVLFAVNNDNISDAIVKKYQKEYREIVSYKNVYYFNAILKELQNDKTYDRIVISEDLEPFANNNYDTIDKFLFEKLDRISDEATKANGEDIQIILICSDRRNKSDDMLNKIFGIGIYNALVGDERSIDLLCKLMNQPRNKKDAKLAYKIGGNNISYQVEDENSVSEAEVQNILAHYKRLGKNEDKYVDSFNNIVSQYTDAQLKIIINYLPANVKSVLEEQSPKYQELLASSRRNSKDDKGKYTPKTAKSLKEEEEEKIKVKMLKNAKDQITKPIVIPSSLTSKKVSRLVGEPIKRQEEPIKQEIEQKIEQKIVEPVEEMQNEELDINTIKDEPNQDVFDNKNDTNDELDIFDIPEEPENNVNVENDNINVEDNNLNEEDIFNSSSDNNEEDMFSSKDNDEDDI